MKKYVVIVAGGKGTRMKTAVPKQFLKLAGKPVLMHTMDAFYRTYGDDITFIIVLPDACRQKWEQLCKAYHYHLPHTIVSGGKERFFSVKNALAAVDAEGVVAVHDGVRPAVSSEVIRRCFETAEIKGNAVPAVAMAESMRRKIAGKTMAVRREEYLLIQTPQTFRTEILHSAYDTEYHERFTDDASVVEHSGEVIHLVEGNKENIKVTSPDDLLFIEWLLSRSKE